MYIAYILPDPTCPLPTLPPRALAGAVGRTTDLQWVIYNFPAQTTDDDITKTMAIRDVLNSADLEPVNIKMRKRRTSGDPNPLSYHVSFRNKSEERGTPIPLLHKCVVVTLESGNQGRASFSREFCDKYGLHWKCMKPKNACTCAAPSSTQ